MEIFEYFIALTLVLVSFDYWKKVLKIIFKGGIKSVIRSIQK